MIDNIEYESLNRLLSCYRGQGCNICGCSVTRREAAMSEYDAILHNMKQLYEAAKTELEDLERRRAQVQMTISKLSKVLGTDDGLVLSTLDKSARKQGAVRAKKGGDGVKKARAPRIREEDLRRDVLKVFTDADSSLSAAEIIAKLLELKYPNTTSFKTRVYGKLSEWSKAGILKKIDRGVYQKL